MACVCSRYNACSNWLTVGHYSPVMSTGRLRACKNKAKSHIINNLLSVNKVARKHRYVIRPSPTKYFRFFSSLKSRLKIYAKVHEIVSLSMKACTTNFSFLLLAASQNRSKLFTFLPLSGHSSPDIFGIWTKCSE